MILPMIAFPIIMHTRPRKVKLRDPAYRAAILGYIIARPGAYYSEIQQALGLPNGSFHHNIDVLLRERMIKKRHHDSKVRFFPYQYTVGELVGYYEITIREYTYLLFLRLEGSATIADFADYFGTTKQNVYQRLGGLKQKGLITYREGIRLSQQAIRLSDQGDEEVTQFMREYNAMKARSPQQCTPRPEGSGRKEPTPSPC